jgi:hypothetical protein
VTNDLIACTPIVRGNIAGIYTFDHEAVAGTLFNQAAE